MTASNREPACVGVSITCSTTRGTVSEKSVPSKVERSAGWFARIPAALLNDPAVSDAALRVYGVLALKTQGAVSSIGMRELGRIVKRSPQTVMRRLQELAIHGDIKMKKGANGQRARYELTSPVFAGKAAASEPEAPGSNRGQNRVKPSFICPACHKARPALLRVGICRSCNLDKRLDRKVLAAVRQELRATA